MTPSGRGSGRLGFTIIETLTALMVASVLLRFGLFGFQVLALGTQADRIVAEIDLVRAAAGAFRADHRTWPRDFRPGLVPPELAPYLPGVSFNQRSHTLDWQNWALPTGLPGRPGSRTVLAVSVSTRNRALGAAVEERLGSRLTHFVLGDTWTYVIHTD